MKISNSFSYPFRCTYIPRPGEDVAGGNPLPANGYQNVTDEAQVFTCATTGKEWNVPASGYVITDYYDTVFAVITEREASHPGGEPGGRVQMHEWALKR